MRATHESTNYTGDVKVMLDWKECNIARGAAATDSVGNTRAYNYLICDSQHWLIICNLVTEKPLVVIGHQISCWKFSYALTELVHAKNLKVHEVEFSQITHKGK